MIVLCHHQAHEILTALERGNGHVVSSINLNLSRVELPLVDGSVVFPDNLTLDVPILRSIADNVSSCVRVEPDGVYKIEAFSEETGRYYSLYPTELAPTMLISGIAMHRIKGIDPYHDTLAKIRAAGPIRGNVLDTCTGLGYTAIEAARTAVTVTTIELDVVVHSIIRQNPWSWRLFETQTITTSIGDSSELLPDYPADSFDVIIHDPPVFSLAGELYGIEFYRELRRVLRPRGRLFHYIGNPQSKSGAVVTRGVVRRLQDAGFTRVTPRPEAFGVTATL